jgi:hypothetical protein
MYGQHSPSPVAPARWKPREHEHYFIILGNGVIEYFEWANTEFDHQAWQCGNCFRERADAEQARAGIKEYLAKFHQKF